ncbi:uncharacterized protein LOC121622461 isoform X2 [Chelmon rostratus]|uniref:uncharacterized protein LOC121622461 isoform X2 n=1 Tax=Chelmon rostratus TaxID=109905 RepID=UPI001BEC5581|nr:uncharacterized protein LOC121622461 isoform X2 [Chelmon rostratus]
MMAEFKWIQTSLFLMVMLQFTAAEKHSAHTHSFTVRVGDDVSLPCENAAKKKHKCGSYTWLYSGSRSPAAVELVQLGKVVERDEPSSDRLSVLQNCSLVMKKVTVEDVGRYTCREFKSGGEQGSDSVVHLSVISMTELKDTDKVTFNCSVVTYERCTHTVQWSFNGNDVDKDNQDLKMSQSSCFASLRFLSSHYFYTSRYKRLKCKVTNGNKVQQFDLIPQPSGEKPGDDTTTKQSTTTKLTRTTENSMKAGTMTMASPTKGWWWLYVIAAVLSVALLMIVVEVIRRRRSEGNKTRTNNNVTDPEDGVSYASISFTKKSNSNTQALDKDEDVTYTAVKALSSSAGASEDISNLYATVNK